MVVDKLETAIRYITTYLGHLAFHGHNIIHSIPIFNDHARSPFALTSVAHHVVTKSNITLSNCAHARKASESPVILILGMCGGRELTFVPPHWIPGWVIAGKGKKSSLGTICLSREAFLEGTLLRRLADINAMTTIVPNFAGVIDGEWNFDLTTWGAHSFRKNKVCKWVPEGSHDGCLKYIWEHRDGWSHEHEGSAGDEKNGKYSIECKRFSCKLDHGAEGIFQAAPATNCIFPRPTTLAHSKLCYPESPHSKPVARMLTNTGGRSEHLHTDAVNDEAL